MAKTIYEAVKDPKTSADWDAQAKYLRQQLEAARKAQRAAAKQEEMQRKEERRQQIAEAMELIEFMKGFTLNNGSTAYDWMTAKLAESKSQDGAADSAEKEVEVLEEETTDENEAETENQYYQHTGGYYNN